MYRLYDTQVLHFADFILYIVTVESGDESACLERGIYDVSADLSLLQSSLLLTSYSCSSFECSVAWSIQMLYCLPDGIAFPRWFVSDWLSSCIDGVSHCRFFCKYPRQAQSQVVSRIKKFVCTFHLNRYCINAFPQKVFVGQYSVSSLGCIPRINTLFQSTFHLRDCQYKYSITRI